MDVFALRAAHRADWLRLERLHHVGGVWLDTTVVLFRPLPETPLFLQAIGDRPHRRHLRAYRLNERYPTVLENWAMAAPPGCPMVTAWFHEFDAAVRAGLPRYCRRLVALPPTDRSPDLPDGIPGGRGALPYLTMHAAGSQVLYHRWLEVRYQHHHHHQDTAVTLDAIVADWVCTTDALANPDGPLRPQALADWNAYRTVEEQLLAPGRPTTDHLPCLLKLRGPESMHLNRALHRRWNGTPLPPLLTYLMLDTGASSYPPPVHHPHPLAILGVVILVLIIVAVLTLLLGPTARRPVGATDRN